MIGETIKEYRKKHGMTQLEFAEKVGVHHTTICALETGRSGYQNITLSTLKKFTDAMGISMESLLNGRLEDNTSAKPDSRDREIKILKRMLELVIMDSFGHKKIFTYKEIYQRYHDLAEREVS